MCTLLPLYIYLQKNSPWNLKIKTLHCLHPEKLMVGNFYIFHFFLKCHSISGSMFRSVIMITEVWCLEWCHLTVAQWNPNGQCLGIWCCQEFPRVRILRFFQKKTLKIASYEVQLEDPRYNILFLLVVFFCYFWQDLVFGLFSNLKLMGGFDKRSCWLTNTRNSTIGKQDCGINEKVKVPTMATGIWSRICQICGSEKPPQSQLSNLSIVDRHFPTFFWLSSNWWRGRFSNARSSDVGLVCEFLLLNLRFSQPFNYPPHKSFHSYFSSDWNSYNSGR